MSYDYLVQAAVCAVAHVPQGVDPSFILNTIEDTPLYKARPWVAYGNEDSYLLHSMSCVIYFCPTTVT